MIDGGLQQLGLAVLILIRPLFVPLIQMATLLPLPQIIQGAYRLIMLGPVYSYFITEKSKFELKFRFGQFYYQEEFKASSSVFNMETAQSRLTYSLGLTYQYRFAKRWAALTNLDFTTAKINTIGGEESISPINLTAGIAFLFWGYIR